MTASATFHHTASQARKASAAAATPASGPVAPADARTAAERYAAADAKVSIRLAMLTGAATLVILVFFLAMMWALGGYGPSAG